MIENQLFYSLVLSLGILLLFLSVQLILLSGYFNYRLLVECWVWYESLVKPCYLLHPSILGYCSTVTYILSIIGWMYYVAEKDSQFRFIVLVLFYVNFRPCYICWAFAFFIKRMLGMAAIVVIAFAFLTVCTFVKVTTINRTSAYWLLPFVVWLTFLVFASFDIARLNADLVQSNVTTF